MSGNPAIDNLYWSAVWTTLKWGIPMLVFLGLFSIALDRFTDWLSPPRRRRRRR